MLWLVSIPFQYYLLVPIIHKLREYDREQKQNLQILNKLTEGFPHVDENPNGEWISNKDAKEKDKREKTENKSNLEVKGNKSEYENNSGVLKNFNEKESKHEKH